MKKTISILTILLLGLMLISYSCKKEEDTIKTDDLTKDLTADFEFLGAGDFEKIVTKALVKLEDCKYVVEGTIEFHKGNKLIAIIDYGEGICDNIASKTVDGETSHFSLDKESDKPGYKKVIIEPLVKIEGCDYIVSGIIKFYYEDKWIATLDYGGGECDEWATKTWEGGSETFSLKKN